MQLINQDVYVNIVGGLRPEGTSVDLAVALAIFSSCRGIAAPVKTLAIGEIGLTGDLRSVRNADKICAEAERLGYEKVILPANNVRNAAAKGPKSCRVIGVRNIKEAMAAFGR